MKQNLFWVPILNKLILLSWILINIAPKSRHLRSQTRNSFSSEYYTQLVDRLKYRFAKFRNFQQRISKICSWRLSWCLLLRISIFKRNFHYALTSEVPNCFQVHTILIRVIFLEESHLQCIVSAETRSLTEKVFDPQSKIDEATKLAVAVFWGGVCRRGGGVCLPGGCLPRGVYTPLWTESQTGVKTLPFRGRCGR